MGRKWGMAPNSWAITPPKSAPGEVPVPFFNRRLHEEAVEEGGRGHYPGQRHIIMARVMMPDLASKQCVPCRGGVPPLSSDETAELLRQIEGWTIDSEHHLSKSCKFPDFAEALAFVNAVGAIAEEQGHHPDLYLSWGQVRIELWTHKINGLTESDFILAAKIDAIPGGRAE